MPIGGGFSVKGEGFYMDNNLDQAHLQGELAYESKFQFVTHLADDMIMSFKTGGGSHNFSHMKSLTANLILGYELFYMVIFTQ